MFSLNDKVYTQANSANRIRILRIFANKYRDDLVRLLLAFSSHIELEIVECGAWKEGKKRGRGGGTFYAHVFH